MTERTPGFSTLAIHAGAQPDPTTGARATPIYQTTSFVFYDTDHAADLFDLKTYGHIYSRISNPTVSILEERVASLEGATGAVAASSGMAAQLAVFLTLLERGDEIVASSHLYGGTMTQLTYTLPRMGITTTFVSPGDLGAWERAVGPKTKALYGETIGNPQGSILDIGRLAGLAKSRGIPLVIDNTLATPYLCRPVEFGATIVLHSLTKFLGGHGNSLGGMLLDSGTFDFSGFPSLMDPSPQYHNLRFLDTFGHYAFLMKARAATLRDTGACLSPMNAFLLLQGVETLSLRMERHVENALGIARFLKAHPRVEWVSYAGLPDHPDHALAERYLRGGPGAVLSFGLKKRPGEDVRQTGKGFIEKLRLFSHLANIGDVRSLVIHPASTTHRQLSDEELRSSGVGPELIRLSVGIENLEDLTWDLDQAFLAQSD